MLTPAHVALLHAPVLCVLPPCAPPQATDSKLDDSAALSPLEAASLLLAHVNRIGDMTAAATLQASRPEFASLALQVPTHVNTRKAS